MNRINFEKYLEFQVIVAAGMGTRSNMPKYVVKEAKEIVDKILEENDTTVIGHVPAKKTEILPELKKEE